MSAMNYVAVTIAAATCLVSSFAASAENFGDKVARCMVQEHRKPGYEAKAAWSRCEKVAQAERDAELAAPAAPAPSALNMRQLKPAMSLHFCVEKEAGDRMGSVSPRKFKDGGEAEGFVWRSVLEKCFPVLTSDEVQGMIYQNYQGNSQRMIDFRDGLLFAERAYVFSVVTDWYSK